MKTSYELEKENEILRMALERSCKYLEQLSEMTDIKTEPDIWYKAIVSEAKLDYADRVDKK